MLNSQHLLLYLFRFYAPDNSLVTVEQLALQHYASEEAGAWQGLHCEGGVWAALFTLLLWDVIFTGVCRLAMLLVKCLWPGKLLMWHCQAVSCSTDLVLVAGSACLCRDLS